MIFSPSVRDSVRYHLRSRSQGSLWKPTDDRERQLFTEKPRTPEYVSYMQNMINIGQIFKINCLQSWVLFLTISGGVRHSWIRWHRKIHTITRRTGLVRWSFSTHAQMWENKWWEYGLSCILVGISGAKVWRQGPAPASWKSMKSQIARKQLPHTEEMRSPISLFDLLLTIWADPSSFHICQTMWSTRGVAISTIQN